jgi:hypothetical protein
MIKKNCLELFCAFISSFLWVPWLYLCFAFVLLSSCLRFAFAVLSLCSDLPLFCIPFPSSSVCFGDCNSSEDIPADINDGDLVESYPKEEYKMPKAMARLFCLRFAFVLPSLCLSFSFRNGRAPLSYGRKSLQNMHQSCPKTLPIGLSGGSLVALVEHVCVGTLWGSLGIV